MSRPTKYLETKNCNRCKLNKNFNDFRVVKPLVSGPNKGKKIGWTDVKGKTRFSICKICENSGFMKRYRLNPYNQLFHNFKKRASFAKVPFVVGVQALSGASVVVVPASLTKRDWPVADLAVALAIFTNDGVEPVCNSKLSKPSLALPDTKILLFAPVVPVVKVNEFEEVL